MGISLAKGQGISLSKAAPGLSKVAFGLGWARGVKTATTQTVERQVPKSGFFNRLMGVTETIIETITSDGGRPRSIDLDASCLLFSGTTLIDNIWFNQLKSLDGVSVSHSGDDRSGNSGWGSNGDDETITVDLDKLPKSVDTLIFTVNSYSHEKFTELARAHVRLLDVKRNNTEVVRYDLNDHGDYTGLIVCSLKRVANDWVFTALATPTNGQTFKAMMPDILRSL